MKLTLTCSVILLALSSAAHALVPNGEYYQKSQQQIDQLQAESAILASIHPKNQHVIQLIDNIRLEINLIQQRVELYKKLEQSQLIMYSFKPQK
ncbi:hypothetical protein AAEU32_02070 [Pseudoalteromonas sp. SSDWG2]|uniref:hypothetical protein n=1 Tax=Pseudoalteromonas sp. SSDWG2 TaxID=3139391 RepID=UPI003BABC6D9